MTPERETDGTGSMRAGGSMPQPSRRALGRALTRALPALVLTRPDQGLAQEAAPGLADRTNALGARLLAKLEQNGEAVAVSPLSLLDAMALLVPGARGRTELDVETLFGPDRRAAQAALHARLGQAGPLRRAGAAWLPLGEPPLPDYRTALTALGADITAVDFADPRTVERINRWVAERTEGRIPNLLSSLPPNATLVLTSALHFAANWDQPFDRRLTAPRRFRRVAGGTVAVPFLHGMRHAPFAQDADIHAVRLRYTTPDFELTLVAPRVDRNPSAVRSLVAQGRLQQALAALRFADASVSVAFPRFDVSTTADLLPALRRLTPVFAADADYSGITGQRVVISQVLQKTVIKVDEQGTEAAAATAILGMRGIALQASSFVADAPFWVGLIHVPSGLHIVSALINLPKAG